MVFTSPSLEATSSADPSRKLAFAGFLICTGLIAFALYLQYVRNQDPCPLCMIQRIVFIAIGFVFLVAAIAGPRGVVRRVLGLLTTALSLVGIGFAARHVWLQHNPPDFDSCTADLFTQLERIPFAAVIQRAIAATGDCAKVDWTLFGLSIAEWSLVWFAILTVLSLVYVARRVGVRGEWA